MTVGHSTRTMEDFIHLLRSHGVKRVVDVRTVPRSRHNPQFNREVLARRLHSARIHYRHLRALGGLRHARRDSQNLGWRNASFRGFADYMQTKEFRQWLEALIRLAKKEQTAIMCAEAVPWRCHRSLIADSLLVKGVGAEHIMSDKRRNLHKLTPFAHIDGKQVSYPRVC
ncbi:MAG: DUF488 family protein [Terriglobia bacterium]